MKLKYGKKPLSYNWPHLNNSVEPLKSIYLLMFGLNEILGYFEGEEARGDTYGYHLIVNNVLACCQSLEKLIHLKNLNMLWILLRQISDLLNNVELLHLDVKNNSLGKLQIQDRLKSYGAFCIWKELNRLEKEMNRDSHYYKDGTSHLSESGIDELLEGVSVDFHHLKEQINQLKLNIQISQFEKRRRDGESLYTFAQVIDPSFKTSSEYFRQISIVFEQFAYSSPSDRIHGTWLSTICDESDGIIRCEQNIYTLADILAIADYEKAALLKASTVLFNIAMHLWPKFMEEGRSKAWEEIFRSGS